MYFDSDSSSLAAFSASSACDFIIIQHFSLCNLFNKQVFCYFLHRYGTNYSESIMYIYCANSSIDHPSPKMLILAKCCLEIINFSRYFTNKTFLCGIALAVIDSKRSQPTCIVAYLFAKTFIQTLGFECRPFSNE